MIAFRIETGPMPRTMTRKEWYAVDHWRRLTERIVREKMKADEAEMRRAMTDALTFGRGEMFLRIADRVCNPPLCIITYPQELKL